jgi:hypothetical protein
MVRVFGWLALLARGDAAQGCGDPGAPARGRCLAPAGRPPEAGLGGSRSSRVLFRTAPGAVVSPYTFAPTCISLTTAAIVDSAWYFKMWAYLTPICAWRLLCPIVELACISARSGAVHPSHELGFIVGWRITRRKRLKARGLGFGGRRRGAGPAWLDASPADPVPLENTVRQVTWGSSGRQAAYVYSLIRPPRMGFRWICRVSMSVTVARGALRSSSGTRWAMP